MSLATTDSGILNGFWWVVTPRRVYLRVRRDSSLGDITQEHGCSLHEIPSYVHALGSWVLLLNRHFYCFWFILYSASLVTFVEGMSASLAVSAGNRLCARNGRVTHMLLSILWMQLSYWSNSDTFQFCFRFNGISLSILKTSKSNLRPYNLYAMMSSPSK